MSPGLDAEGALVPELDVQGAGDHVDELLAVVGVETLATGTRRHPDKGGIHNLLPRGHLLEAHAVVPLHHGPVRVAHERRALVQVGPE